MDIEVGAQHVIQLHQNTFAFRGWDVGDRHMAGEGVTLRAEAPYVEVVDIENAVDRFHAGTDLVELYAARSAFEKNVEGFADDVDAGPEDESGNDERKYGIDPGMPGEQDCRASGDYSGGGERVSCHVEEGAAHIDVAGATPEEGGDDAVHENTGSRHPHHQAGLDGDGSAEAVDGFNGDPDGDDDQGRRVDEGGEDTGALVAESLGIVARAVLKINRYEAEQEGQEVGGIVAGLRKQGEGVGAKAEDESDSDVGESSYEREAEYGLCP